MPASDGGLNLTPRVITGALNETSFGLRNLPSRLSAWPGLH